MAVLSRITAGSEFPRKWFDAANPVRRVTSSNNQTNLTSSTFEPMIDLTGYYDTYIPSSRCAECALIELQTQSFLFKEKCNA